MENPTNYNCKFSNRVENFTLIMVVCFFFLNPKQVKYFKVPHMGKCRYPYITCAINQIPCACHVCTYM